jgi:PAS domain-containing protein
MNQPLRVLMVEDSKDDATLLLRALRRGGYEVVYEVVDTPAAMRAALERQDWDAITSDHAMPHFSAPAQQTKDALEISEARYRRLFETAQDGILILDADTGQILDMDPFLIDFLGYSKEEFLGKKL